MLVRMKKEEIKWLEKLLEALPESKVHSIIAEGYEKDYVNDILVDLAEATLEIRCLREDVFNCFLWKCKKCGTTNCAIKEPVICSKCGAHYDKN